jgi:hypothetical protein
MTKPKATKAAAVTKAVGQKTTPKPRAVKATKASAAANARAVGDRVIELRADGTSYGAIAKELSLGKSRDAFAALVTALEALPAAEQRAVRAQERRRLDALEKRTKDRSDGSELTRKLEVIAQLRKQLLAG